MRIAVIGAGSSGIAAAKACIEEGFDVVVYEKTDFTGGLWRYHDDDVNGIASVAKSTIINSSKEMSAFSDFPPPEDFPNYMHNTKMIQYLELYGKSFHFNKYVNFCHEIIKCEFADDYDKTGRWTLTIHDIRNAKVFSETFDGVMICTGHHVTPQVPSFPGQEMFKGKIMHTHSYKKPEEFSDKTIVIIGIGNSGGDAAVELSAVATNHIFVNDALPNRILSGTVIVKGNIERFTENGVIFENDNGQETRCDTILFATGYKVTFPFISQEIISTEENRVDLYKYMFSPMLQHPKTLAFISLPQPIGPLFPIAEIQSRYYVLLMANKLKLPSKEIMMSDVEDKKRDMRLRYYSGERHTLQIDWIPFMDEIATIIGVKPNLFNYFFTDPILWFYLFFGPCVPYQYRLQGPYSWSDARKAILSVNKRVYVSLKTKYMSKKD